jgi:hypothetical protein
MGQLRSKMRLYSASSNAVSSKASGVTIHSYHRHGLIFAPPAKRWSRLRARCICPRRHLRVLPTRTRPSLFGGD